MFDTHCHLNFKAYRKNLADVIARTRRAGINKVVIPGTNVETSRGAVQIASAEQGLYAATGIHPHHVFELYVKLEKGAGFDEVVGNELQEIRSLLREKSVVAVGEVGLDRHMYIQTKYAEYRVTEEFIDIQKKVMEQHILLAIEHNLSLIIHNREAAEDMLSVLRSVWDSSLRGRTVFHCCEANSDLLQFACENEVFIGVDGDITYSDIKREFIRRVPRKLLVLETDGPYLLPEPLRSRKEYPNAPYNLPVIAQKVAEWREEPVAEVEYYTGENADRLFSLT
ncbi:MAG: TatD family hydrolase [Patescibacteria group bacterium]|nr:TatD family hydrolase [Patescibacteria group bacterium]